MGKIQQVSGARESLGYGIIPSLLLPARANFVCRLPCNVAADIVPLLTYRRDVFGFERDSARNRPGAVWRALTRRNWTDFFFFWCARGATKHSSKQSPLVGEAPPLIPCQLECGKVFANDSGETDVLDLTWFEVALDVTGVEISQSEIRSKKVI